MSPEVASLCLVALCIVLAGDPCPKPDGDLKTRYLKASVLIAFVSVTFFVGRFCVAYLWMGLP